jgi:hypothetical protein
VSDDIFFELDEVASAGRKTTVWRVRATRDYAILARIAWFGRWRQYAFFPEPGTIYNPAAIDAINAKIRDLMAARKAA